MQRAREIHNICVSNNLRDLSDNEHSISFYYTVFSKYFGVLYEAVRSGPCEHDSEQAWSFLNDC